MGGVGSLRDDSLMRFGDDYLAIITIAIALRIDSHKKRAEAVGIRAEKAVEVAKDVLEMEVVVGLGCWILARGFGFGARIHFF